MWWYYLFNWWNFTYYRLRYSRLDWVVSQFTFDTWQDNLNRLDFWPDWWFILQLSQSLPDGLEHQISLGIFQRHDLNWLEHLVHLEVTHLTRRLLLEFGSVSLTEGRRIDITLPLCDLVRAYAYRFHVFSTFCVIGNTTQNGLLAFRLDRVWADSLVRLVSEETLSKWPQWNVASTRIVHFNNKIIPNSIG